MGQKVNPVGLRLKITRTWDSKWYSDKKFSSLVFEDFKIRKYLKNRLANAGVSKIEIDRAAQRLMVRIHSARPGIVIGKKGVEIEALKKSLESVIKKPCAIDIVEVRRPELDAQLVAENVAGQLLRRISFRRAMKKAVSMSMKFGAQGVRIACSGRLGGAELARREWYLEGRVPLHTLRADIDYGLAEAKTTYGIIGIKVWIFKGEVLPSREEPLVS